MECVIFQEEFILVVGLPSSHRACDLLSPGILIRFITTRYKFPISNLIGKLVVAPIPLYHHYTSDSLWNNEKYRTKRKLTLTYGHRLGHKYRHVDLFYR